MPVCHCVGYTTPGQPTLHGTAPLTKSDAAGHVALGDPEADPGAADDQHARDVHLQQEVASQPLQVEVHHQGGDLLCRRPAAQRGVPAGQVRKGPLNKSDHFVS